MNENNGIFIGFRRRLLPIVAISLVINVLVITKPAEAANLFGPDTSFGENGSAVLSGSARKMATQSDGKILVAGAIVNGGEGCQVARFNPDGKPDTNWGDAGKVIQVTPGVLCVPETVYVQPDAKILVGGTFWRGAQSHWFILRLSSNGLLDWSFGRDGIAEQYADNPAWGTALYSMDLQSDGKIVAVGTNGVSSNNGSMSNAALSRFNTDGSLDRSFGNTGVVDISLPGEAIHTCNGCYSGSWGYGVKIQPDGNAIVFGDYYPDNNSSAADLRIFLARYKSGGSLDTTFGDAGIVTNPGRVSSTHTQISSRPIVLQSDGKILISAGMPGGGVYVARYSISGLLDPSFGALGKVSITEPDTGMNNLTFLTQQPDKKILVGYNTEGNTNFRIRRIGVDGTYDSGASNVFERAQSFYVSDVVLQENGRLFITDDTAIGGEVIRLTTDIASTLTETPNYCSDVLFVAARGSGEKGPGNKDWTPTTADPLGMGATVKSAFDKFTSEIGTKRTISAVSADFSAESVYNISHDIEKYFNGLGDGVSFVSLYLKNRAMICPDERIVLAGYSQGAMVMHRVAQQLYKLRNSTDSSPRNNKTILSRIDAIILIGDGDRVPSDNAQYYGNMRQRSSGVGLGFLGAQPQSGTSTDKFPNDDVLLPKSKIHQVCALYDVVCDFAFKHIVSGAVVHTLYSGSSIVDKASIAAANSILRVAVPTPRFIQMNATRGKPFSYQLQAKGSPLKWEVAPGSSLPRGLRLVDNGLIKGTPKITPTGQTIVNVRASSAGQKGNWVAVTLKW